MKIFTHPQITIDQRSFNDDPCLYIKFRGKLDNTSAQKACNEWGALLQNSSLEKFVIVWDCTDMTGFENSARNTWQECLTQSKHKISFVVLISGNIVIRSAGKLMLKLLGINCVLLRKREALSNLAKEHY